MSGILRWADDVVAVDVLVIGSGGAGAEAAIGADETGATVLVVDRGVNTRSGATVTAGHTCCAALGPGDSPELHFEDTVRGGHFMANQRLVETYVEEAPKRVVELDEWGAKFIKKDGEFQLIESPGGHSKSRAVHVGFLTGPAIMAALRRELNRRKIEKMNDILITNLLTNENCVVGATGLNLLNGNFIVFRAKATVLATGGAGQVYDWTTMALECTGDGYSLAYRAGAELVDMEFVQFLLMQTDPRLMHLNCAVGLVLIPRWRRRIRESGVRLINALGEDFIRRYDPKRAIYTTRDQTAIAVQTEMNEDRGPIYFDLTPVPREVLEEEFGDTPGSWLPDIQREGYDLGKDPIEVTLAAHHFMGGVRINERGETGVRGLYAAGEVAGGIHGSNRLGGNALTEIAVFGRIAGVNAARHALSSDPIGVREKQVRTERERVYRYIDEAPKKGESPTAVRKRLQKLMSSKVGVIRDGEGLKEAVKEILGLREYLPKVSLRSDARSYNSEWIEALLLPRMLDVAEMVARAALLRAESRGAHYRADYPATDNKNWLKNIVLKHVEGEMRLTTRPVVVTKIAPEG
ncbi:MAG: FAD-binding protein [Candidatus Geothermarchaeales archaeon]